MSGLAARQAVSVTSTQRDSTVPVATRLPASVLSTTSTSASSLVPPTQIAEHVSSTLRISCAIRANNYCYFKQLRTKQTVDRVRSRGRPIDC